MKKSEERILRDFQNFDVDMAAKAIRGNISNNEDDSFEARRNQQELDKFVKGALYILNNAGSKDNKETTK